MSETRIIAEAVGLRKPVHEVGVDFCPSHLVLGEAVCSDSDMGFRMTQSERGSLSCDSLTLGPWANYLHFLNVSLPICKMGAIIAPVLKDSWEAPRS